jgi:hypothetical protein
MVSYHSFPSSGEIGGDAETGTNGSLAGKDSPEIVSHSDPFLAFNTSSITSNHREPSAGLEGAVAENRTVGWTTGSGNWELSHPPPDLILKTPETVSNHISPSSGSPGGEADEYTMNLTGSEVVVLPET